jgi:uncharacterized protein with GYD domain
MPHEHARESEGVERTKAYILITVAVGTARDVQRQIRDVGAERATAESNIRIDAVDLLAGRYDVAVVVEASTAIEIGEVVTEWLQGNVRGITGTITLLRIG